MLEWPNLSLTTILRTSHIDSLHALYMQSVVAIIDNVMNILFFSVQVLVPLFHC